MISQVEQIVQYHEQKLIEEEKEGQKFDQAQIEELGIYTRNGMQYDKEGNLIGMTKKDIQLKLLENNIKLLEVEEIIREMTDSINSL